MSWRRPCPIRSTSMALLLLLGPARPLVIAAAVFVPFERLAAANRAQPVFGWQSWLVHANVRVRYGPLGWAFVSPQFHHWHHAAERDAYDTNFASLLACWDVLFGTARVPGSREPERYGASEPVPAGYVARFYYPFKRTTPAAAEHDSTSGGRPDVAGSRQTALTRA